MPDTIEPRDASQPSFAQPLFAPIKRRSFFMYAGATAGATALVLAGCSKDAETVAPSINVSVGYGDASVLNYAYALEQLEAAFYAKVVAATASNIPAAELAVLTKMATHEAIHRDFLQAAINRDFAGKLLQTLTFKFDGINFSDRTQVLTTAKAFEDLGVAAYNGAGKLLKVAAYVGIAGQIVSVEARHATYVRDLLVPGSFAGSDVVDSAGLDKQLAPADVIKIFNTYLDATKVQLDVSTIGQ